MRFLRSVLSATLIALLASACDGENSYEQSEDPATCDCPLEWQIDNIAICGEPSGTPGEPPLVFSTRVNGADKPYCDTIPESRPFPQALPASAWSTQRIRSTCGGSGQLCFALRQGDFENPTAADCVLATHCTEFTYSGDNEFLELPPISAWTVSDQACATKYEANGGYLEFTNDSPLGCEPVVRNETCLIKCARSPNLPECVECRQRAVDELDTSF